jgi:tetratricopeptide (TPR) repeat protein
MRARDVLARIWALLRNSAARMAAIAARAAKATPDALRVAADMLKSIRDIVISGAVIFAVVFCVLIVVTQVRRAPPMLEPIDLPQSLTSNGLTREDVTDRIIAQITFLRRQADGAMENTVAAAAKPAHSLFGRHAAPAPVQGFAGDIGAIGRDGEKKSIVIPETGISIDTISAYAKDLLGSEQLRFSGEIMSVDSCPGRQGKGLALELREQRTGRLILMPDCETGPDALDAIVSDAAMDIVGVTEPTVAEVLLYGSRRYLALALAHRVLDSRFPEYPDTVKARAHDIIGSAAAESRNYPAAAGEFRQAAALDDTAGYIYKRNLCEALGADGKTSLDTALGYCNAALADGRGHASTHVSMGNVYLAHQKYGDAIASYERARADGDGQPGTLNAAAWNLALAFDGRGMDEEDQGKIAAAREDYKEAIRLSPGYAYLYEGLGSLELDQNDEPGARAAFQAAANLAPANGQLLTLIAMDLSGGPHPGEATAYFAQGFARDRAGTLATINRYVLGAIDRKHFDVALYDLAAALKGDPGNADLRREIEQTGRMRPAPGK